MSIERDLLAWDGKSAGDIKAVFDAHRKGSDFADKIVELSVMSAYEKGGTWLLKAWLEEGHKLEQAQVSKLYRSLSQFEHWEAKLHILQSIPFMPIAEGDCNKVYQFLMNTLTDHNKFVRAWSYNGFYELSKKHPKYLNETKQYFEMAMRDEAPSVKARIRNIVKKGF